MSWTWDQAKAVGIRDDDHWPYGPNLPTATESRQALIDWAAENGLKLAAPRTRCLHWVAGQARRCSSMRSTSHAGKIDQWSMHELDHPTFWTRDGQPALILAQPYAMPSVEWVNALTAAWDIDITLTDKAPWYGFETHGVHITPRVRNT